MTTSPERMSEPATRILIVEDEDSLADSVRYNLEREGYEVTVATDGRSAVARFREERPALVILDLMLPELSGLDVCRTIRDESDVPIIMVTAKDSIAVRTMSTTMPPISAICWRIVWLPGSVAVTR